MAIDYNIARFVVDNRKTYTVLIKLLVLKEKPPIFPSDLNQELKLTHMILYKLAKSILNLVFRWKMEKQLN